MTPPLARDGAPELVPVQSFTTYFVGARRSDGGVERLSRTYDVDPRVAFARLKWHRPRRPDAQVFKRSIFDSLVREAS